MELSAKEMNEWDGHINYISHHGVEKSLTKANDAMSLHLGVNLSPKIRKMRPSLELQPHEVNRIASLVKERKLT